jgi:hypothetical protein
MKVTIAEIHNAFEWLTSRVIALQNHTIINPDVDDVMARLEQHGIQLDYVPMTDDELLSAVYLNRLSRDAEIAIERGRKHEQAILARIGYNAYAHPPKDASELVKRIDKRVDEFPSYTGLNKLLTDIRAFLRSE